jgi:predicted phage terminase large subunit-like protein
MSTILADMPLPTLEEIQQELARKDLLRFAKYLMPTYIISKHNTLLAEKLEAVERGEIKRLMVSMPPRHGKSLLCSQMFPCWLLGKRPKLEIMQSGYSAEIALEHSRKARDFFVSPEYKEIFPDVHHSPERAGQNSIVVQRQAAHLWGTQQGGRYYASGVHGGITGRGADIHLIDDPVKDREEAESLTTRKKVWEWYLSSVYTRRSPQCAIILVMTRWNTQDLAGKLVDKMSEGGDKWDILNMPAINDDGEALWPERWPIEELRQIKAVEGKYEWNCLYQQRPYIKGGNRFKIDLVQVHDSIKDFPDVRYVRFWDLASTKKERDKDDPDYTSGSLCGITKVDGLEHLWVKDVKRCQSEAPERDKMIKTTTEADGRAVAIGIESVAGYKDTYTTLARILQGRYTVKKITVSADKSVRAAPVEPIMEIGHVHILRAPWNEMWLQQFGEFPSGAHDDDVDSTCGAYAMLSKKEPGFIDRRLIGA